MDDLEKCVHHNQMVKHINWKGTKKPDCYNCDGYGEDAIKYEWNCYNPMRKNCKRMGNEKVYK